MAAPRHRHRSLLLLTAAAVVGLLSWQAVSLAATFQLIDGAASSRGRTGPDTVTATVTTLDDLLGVRVMTLGWVNENGTRETGMLAAPDGIQQGDEVDVQVTVGPARFTTGGGVTRGLGLRQGTPPELRAQVHDRAVWLPRIGLAGMLISCCAAALGLDLLVRDRARRPAAGSRSVAR